MPKIRQTTKKVNNFLEKYQEKLCVELPALWLSTR